MKNSPHYQLFALAVPMILSNITVPLLGLVDTAVIGHLPHAYYLGASTVGATIITAITWLCGFLRMTTTGLAAQANGQQDVQQNLIVLARGIVVALLIGLFVLIVQNPLLHFAVSLSGASDNIQNYAIQYSQIRIWGVPAALANLVLIGWLLGNHHAKSVMWLLIVTNVINLVLDILFVVYLQWQITGIATATLIAEYASLLMAIWIIRKKLTVLLSEFLTRVRPHLLEPQALIDYFKLNRDILLRTLSLQLCFVFITFQGARLGDIVVAANAILMNFLLFISFGLDGIANAAEVMAGKAKGQRSLTKLKQIFHISVLWTLIFAAFYCLLFLLFGKQLIRVISSIDEVVAFADQYLIWLICMPLIACWSYLYDGIYIGLTHAKAMRNSMIFSTFGCFFPAWWLLQDLGNHGLWSAFSLFMLARGVTLAWDFRYRLIARERL